MVDGVHYVNFVCSLMEILQLRTELEMIPHMIFTIYY